MPGRDCSQRPLGRDGALSQSYRIELLPWLDFARLDPYKRPSERIQSVTVWIPLARTLLKTAIRREITTQHRTPLSKFTTQEGLHAVRSPRSLQWKWMSLPHYFTASRLSLEILLTDSTLQGYSSSQLTKLLSCPTPLLYLDMTACNPHMRDAKESSANGHFLT